MFNSKFDQKCTHAYISARKDASGRFLFILRMENLNIKEVNIMYWKSFLSNIKRWKSVVKIFMQVSLTSELCLYDQILRELGPMTIFCFVKASKTSMLQHQDFANVFPSGRRQK